MLNDVTRYVGQTCSKANHDSMGHTSVNQGMPPCAEFVRTYNIGIMGPASKEQDVVSCLYMIAQSKASMHTLYLF